MASRLLSRSKTLTRSLLHSSSSSSSQSIRYLHSLSSLIGSHPSVSTSPAIPSFLGSAKNPGCEKNLSHLFSAQAHGEPISKVYDSAARKAVNSIKSGRVAKPNVCFNEGEVVCFSPLETASAKTRGSGLVKESLKIKRFELSQKITLALIPVLILTSKSSLATSLLIFSVYWQIYGFFKEIFLDYVHHEVTREWVLVYFKVLLLILAKDTLLHFGLV